MSWNPSEPNLLDTKPDALIALEKLTAVYLDSMPGLQVEEKIRDAAEELATSYRNKSHNGNFDTCVLLVSGVLRQTGGEIGGSVGGMMIGTAEGQAKTACRILYPEPDEANTVEY